MSQDFNENLENNEQNSSKKSEYAYKNVMNGKQNKRTWSVISFVLAIASILFCSIPTVGIILGLLAIGFAIFSRLSIGYFDGFSLIGLLLAIVGVVFSIAAIVLKNILVNLIVSIL